jgi:erythromycin esterase-like protein
VPEGKGSDRGEVERKSKSDAKDAKELPALSAAAASQKSAGEGGESTVVLSKLPKRVATRQEIQAAQQAAERKKKQLEKEKEKKGDSDDAKTKKIAPVKKRTGKSGRKAVLGAKKVVFFCSWVASLVEEEELETLGSCVVAHFREKIQLMEQETATKEMLPTSGEVQPPAVVVSSS